jgi:preprotein translocase subunit YajC
MIHEFLAATAAVLTPLAMGAVPGGAGGEAPSQTAFWGQFASLPIIFAIFYFIMIRPQQQKQKDHDAMLNALKKGDEVLTSGGLYGKIHAVTDQIVTLEIAPNTRVRVARSRIEGREGKDGGGSKEPKDTKETKES